MKNTGVMCMVHIGEKNIDMGNYFTDDNGEKCLITSRELAEKYSQLVACPIYVRRPTSRAVDLLSCPQCEGDLHNGYCQKCKAAFEPANR